MGDVAEANLPDFFEFIRNGMSVKQSKECDGLPVTRIETIANGEIDTDRFGYAGLNKSENEKWLLKRGDILFSHINSVEHIGKCALFDMDMDVVHGMNLLCFRPNIDRAEPRYIKWLFRSPQFRSLIMPFVNKAVNQASISIGNLNNIRIKVPPLDEQKRIAAILDQADDVRRKRQHAIDRLNQLGQAIFHDMFGDPNNPPDTLDARPLGEVTICLDSQRRPVKANERAAGNVPYYGANGQQGWIDRPLFNESLVLVAEDGGHFEAPERGVAYRIDGPSWVNNHAHILQAKDNVLTTEYLHRSLRHYDFMRKISGSTRSKLTKAQLVQCKIAVPPFVEQLKFDERMAGLHHIEREQTANLNRTQDLFSSLQHRAFTGQL